MLYVNILYDKKKSCEMMVIFFFVNDVQFVIFVVQDWKIEVEN